MCEHLNPLEQELSQRRISVTYRGSPWSQNCREWVYYDCVLDTESLRRRMSLPAFVVVHTNSDIKSGLEHGFECQECRDAIMGVHPDAGKGKIVVA